LSYTSILPVSQLQTWGRWNRETWQDANRSNSTIEQRGPWAEYPL